MENLHQLGIKHGTDKVDGVHTYNNENYMTIYEKYFAIFRNQPINILEIGVKSGSSVKVWEEYFPNANIYGLDIDPSCKQFESERIHIEIGSQDDPNVIEKIIDKAKKFDIILDDGSHVNELTLKSFDLLFPYLVSNGYYIMEDMQPSYQDLTLDSKSWPGMQYNKDINLVNKREDLNNFFFKHIEEMDWKRGSLAFVHFWFMICVMCKR